MKLRNSSLTKWLLVLLILTTACDDEESKRELKILHQLAAETPLYPGFVQLRSSDFRKPGHVAIIRCYSARANDDDVRRFYSQLFESKGWALTAEHALGGFHPLGSYRRSFRKGRYAIVLQHDKLDDPSGMCNYSLTYYWNPP